MTQVTCNKCLKTVKNGTYSIRCNNCSGWLHRDCANLSIDEIKFYDKEQKNENGNRFVCSVCLPQSPKFQTTRKKSEMNNDILIKQIEQLFNSKLESFTNKLMERNDNAIKTHTEKYNILETELKLLSTIITKIDKLEKQMAILSKQIEETVFSQKLEELHMEVKNIRASNVDMVKLLTSFPNRSNSNLPNMKEYQNITMIDKVRDTSSICEAQATNLYSGKQSKDGVKQSVSTIHKNQNKNQNKKPIIKLSTDLTDNPTLQKKKNSSSTQLNINDLPPVEEAESNEKKDDIEMKQKSKNWELQKKRGWSSKKLRPPPIQGKKDGNSSLKVAPKLENGYSWLFASGLSADSVVKDVEDYLLNNGVSTFICEKLQTKKKCVSSFKVGVPKVSEQSVMSPDFWPIGVYVNKFLNLKKLVPQDRDKVSSHQRRQATMEEN